MNRYKNYHVEIIDEMTDDLLRLADIMEELEINFKQPVRNDWVNPVSLIRSKVEIIWEETIALYSDTRERRDGKKSAYSDIKIEDGGDHNE